MRQKDEEGVSKKKSARAFAPANISCIFKIVKGNTPKKTGSLGCGFTLREGASVRVSRAKRTGIFYNRKSINFPTVKEVIRSLTEEKIEVRIASALPLGSGFGMSGASALATAYALKKLLGIKKKNKELAMIAHLAEVKNGTGLGDVINQYYGGCLVKFEPSYRFRAHRLQVGNIDVWCKVFGALSTKKVVSDATIRERINHAAEECLKVLKKRRGKRESFKDMVSLSKTFALQSGLLKNEKVKSLISQVEREGGAASMIMLGNSMFSTIPFKGAMKLRLSQKGAW